MINTAGRHSPDAVLLTFKYLLSEKDVKQMCLVDGESRFTCFGVLDFVNVVSALVRSAEEHPIFAWKWIRVLVELVLENRADCFGRDAITAAMKMVSEALKYANSGDKNVAFVRRKFGL